MIIATTTNRVLVISLASEPFEIVDIVVSFIEILVVHFHVSSFRSCRFRTDESDRDEFVNCNLPVIARRCVELHFQIIAAFPFGMERELSPQSFFSRKDSTVSSRAIVFKSWNRSDLVHFSPAAPCFTSPATLLTKTFNVSREFGRKKRAHDSAEGIHRDAEHNDEHDHSHLSRPAFCRISFVNSSEKITENRCVIMFTIDSRMCVWIGKTADALNE